MCVWAHVHAPGEVAFLGICTAAQERSRHMVPPLFAFMNALQFAVCFVFLQKAASTDGCG